MAALDFPAAPTNGQTYAGQGASWQWDGAKWTGAGVGGPAYLTDAPSDSTAYGRLNAAWAKVPWYTAAGGVNIGGVTPINVAGALNCNDLTIGGTLGFNLFYSGGYKYRDPGTAGLIMLDRTQTTATMGFALSVTGTAGAAATTPQHMYLNTSGLFALNAITAGTGVYATTTLYINPANSWEWQFYNNGGNHVQAHRANWYEMWNGSTGTYTWNGVNGQLMSLDGNGGFTTRADITSNYGLMRSLGGRIMAQSAGGSPSVTVHDSSASSAYALFCAGSQLRLGPADGAGIPGAAGFTMDGSGNADMAGQVIIRGTLYPKLPISDVHNFPGLSIYGQANNVRVMQLEANAYISKDGAANLNVVCTNGAPATLMTAGGSIRIQSDNNFVISGQGWKPGGGTWADTSDARIKTVEGDYTQGLAAIVQLQPRIFTFLGNEELDNVQSPITKAMARTLTLPIEPMPKEWGGPPATLPSPHAIVAEQGHEYIGLVAQEAEGPMPEMITLASGTIDGEHVDDIRMLDTSALSMAFINAFKEVNARLLALEGAVP